MFFFFFALGDTTRSQINTAVGRGLIGVFGGQIYFVKYMCCVVFPACLCWYGTQYLAYIMRVSRRGFGGVRICHLGMVMDGWMRYFSRAVVVLTFCCVSEVGFMSARINTAGHIE